MTHIPNHGSRTAADGWRIDWKVHDEYGVVYRHNEVGVLQTQTCGEGVDLPWVEKELHKFARKHAGQQLRLM